MVRKQVSFQDRKKENKSKFSSIEEWYYAVFWLYVTTLSRLLKIVLFEFKHTECFTCHGGYLLNTTLSRWQVPGVGFSVAGLDRAKFGFYLFWSFSFIVVLGISTLLKAAFWQTSIHINHWWKFCNDRTRRKSGF